MAAMSAARNRAITLVLGGVRSGKSWYAHQLAKSFASVTFIATARPSDAEMRRRIAAHRRERPKRWRTVEAPTALAAIIRRESAHAQVIVIDCLTTYLGNQMMDSRHKWRETKAALAESDTEEVCDAIESAKSSVIIVSNEVGSGVVPAFRSGRIYRDLLGELNKHVARIADLVVFMIAGQPLIIKPEGSR
jgi:adenosylcobinamide kinase / adenosylcobinamide-phosphate guanylyltransferase